MNAGTDGPVPDVAVEAAAEEMRAEARDGRVTAHFERRIELQDELRAAYGRVVGAPPEQIALTTSATDGLGRVIAGLRLGAGDEVVTSDQEHPGLLGPLLQARRNGASVREVPWGEVPAAVGDETTLVALSHVNWLERRRDPARALRALRPADPRRRAGRGRRPGRRPLARLRGLRRGGPEVAVRARRLRLPLARPVVRRAARRRHAELPHVRGRGRGPRRRVQGHGAAVRHADARPRGARDVGGGHAPVRGDGAREPSTTAPRRSRGGWPTSCAPGTARSPRAGTPRSWRGARRTTRPCATGSRATA